MAWLKSNTMTDGQVSVNAKIFEFKHGLVQAEDREDIRIFQEYLHCEVIPDEMAKKLIEEAEKATKEAEEAEGAKTRKKKG
jgi:hypothetical protein